MFFITSRRIALTCIGILCNLPVLATPPANNGRQLPTIVLLDFSYAVPERFWEALKTELDRPEIVQSLGSSQIWWIKRDQFRERIDFPEILQVSLQGDCEFLEQHSDAASGPLGWVYLVDGQIQPFALVNCNRVGYVLGPAIRGLTHYEVQHKMARAVARIVAHELTHIMTQNSRHTILGLQKAHLTPAELLRDGLP